MNIKIREIRNAVSKGDYAEVIVTHDNYTLDLGFHDAHERLALAKILLDAAAELLSKVRAAQ